MEIGLCQETAIHVCNDDGGLAPVDVGLYFESGKVLGLAQVKELEVGRVVDVPQGIYVVEAQLDRRCAVERVLGFYTVIHII